MGAGASIPTSEEAAKEAGYTDEQIAEYKAKQEAEAAPGEAAPAEAAPAEAAPAPAEAPAEATAEVASAETPTAEQEKSARVIQVAAKKKDERKVAKVRVAEQKVINSIGSKIAVEVSLDMQKKLHSSQFSEACAKIFASSDSDKSGGLVVGELVVAMNAVRTEMAVECEEITNAQAETAVFDFDLDRSKALDADEFTKLSKILILASIIKEKPSDVAKYCFAAEGVNGKEGGMPSKPVGLPPVAGGKLPSLSGGLKPLGADSKPLCDLSAPRRKSIQLDEPPADRPKSS